MSLSKSRYMSGLQCRKKLWWEVHEPNAPELETTAGQQTVYDRGHEVGALARTYVPGGVLIDLPFYETRQRVEATARAIDAGVPVIYEASFMADDVFVAVDILERNGDGFTLAEVKSTLSAKRVHIPDVAIQLHVARRSGLDVERAQVMHLNRECRHPDLSNLFVREDVTPLLEDELRDAPARIDALHAMLAGALPEIATGPHCSAPYPCPFVGRCWAPQPEHHISTLYSIRGTKAAQLEGEGYRTLLDLPADYEASGPAKRQLQSVRMGRIVVEAGLRDALESLNAPIAFLDFETIAPVVPVWPGCAPLQSVPVQFSCHVVDHDELTHHAWLADGPGDPREAFARAMIAACAGVRTVLAYNASYEQTEIRKLARALPHLAPELMALSGSIRDLLAIVRDHVYHPDFQGSFSIKTVLPALVPGPWYDELEIQDGGTASAALESLLLREHARSPGERVALREQLLRYCEMDTLAMVRLYERLAELVR
ncbi:MAG TPA: DUF2779 domain-containing protein [Candidatus Krumholzibacteria bacterium]